MRRDEMYEETGARFKARMSAGEVRGSVVQELAGIYNVEPATIRQRLRRLGLWQNDPKMAAARDRNRRRELPAPKLDEPLPPPVYRDPCARCGTRADMGCRHRPHPFSEQRLVAGRFTAACQ
jgi:hypothetical protein